MFQAALTNTILSITDRELKQYRAEQNRQKGVILSISNRELKLIAKSKLKKDSVILSISNRELKLNRYYMI